MTAPTRDPARSYASINEEDLARLGRCADADLERFITRHPKHARVRDRLLLVALAQGAAEHYLRGKRGIWDLDIILCFSGETSRQLRRPVVSWDWGPSKFGRCPYDPPEYQGRAVDVKYWTFESRLDSVDALCEWLRARTFKHPDRSDKLDVAHEPVVLISPSLGDVVWDPGSPPPPRPKSDAHRRPAGKAPP